MLGHFRLVAPARFSRAWWLFMAAAGVVGANICAFALFLVSDEPDRFLILIAVAFGLAVGDILAATYMEIFAPTRVTIGPGESRTTTEGVRETAIVIDGFDGESSGRVRVRGEVWRARIAAEEESGLSPGETARIIGRDGLTLFVRAERDVA